MNEAAKAYSGTSARASRKETSGFLIALLVGWKPGPDNSVMCPMDWLNTLDIKKAIDNITYDQIGDWYRDPWGWPENDFILNGGKNYITDRANSSGARRVANIDVPKENFSFRPAVVLDPEGYSKASAWFGILRTVGALSFHSVHRSWWIT